MNYCRHQAVWMWMIFTKSVVSTGITTAQRNEYNKDYEENMTESATLEVEQEVIANLEKYFVAVVQLADGEEVARVLQDCDTEHVAILQSIMEGQKAT